jgi:hypothetical protein
MKDKIGTLWTYGSTNTRVTNYITFEQLYEAIKSFKELEDFTLKLKELKELGKIEERNNLKNKQHYVNMCGKYTYRNDASLIKDSFNWIVAWDIDKKDNLNKDFSKLFDIVCNNSSVILCAHTSGGGLRGFSRLKENAFEFKNEEYYTRMIKFVHPYLEFIFDSKLDIGQYKLSQPWYLLYDENVYVNWNATPIINVDYWRPLKERKPIYIPMFKDDDLVKKYINALNTIPYGTLHYEDVLRLMTYAKEIQCDPNTISDILISKISSASVLYKKTDLTKMWKPLRAGRFPKFSAIKLIKKSGGNY